MLVLVVRKDKETGGHAVCDRSEYKSCGAAKVEGISGVP
jgi:hypothetical protein